MVPIGKREYIVEKTGQRGSKRRKRSVQWRVKLIKWHFYKFETNIGIQLKNKSIFLCLFWTTIFQANFKLSGPKLFLSHMLKIN